MNPSAPERTPLRAVLADDDDGLCRYVAAILAPRFAVTAVADGETALAEIRRQRPDILLCDVAMPRLDGLGVVRALRADPALRTLPIILLSARTADEARLEGLKSGADDYITKPFKSQELLARVESQVTLARLRTDDSAALQAAVQESGRQQRFLEIVASNTPDLHYVFNRQHRFIYANKALLAMWGRTWEEAAGRNCLELGYEPWHAAMHDREIEQVIATRRPIRGEVAFTGTNGRRLYDYIFSPVIGADGEVEAIAGTTRDVTDARRAAGAARFLADLLDQLAPLNDELEIIQHTVVNLGRHLGVHRCYFIECHEREGLVKVSHNWVRDHAPSLAGRHQLDDFGGATCWREFLKGDFTVTDTQNHPLFSPAVAANYAGVGVHAYAVQPIKRVGDWQIVLAVTENAPRQWTGDELRLLDNVAARVWPLVERVRSEQALRLAWDQALAASRAKDEFLASLSHELRTPLNPVLLVASASAENPALPDEVRADFRMIGDNISLQARLIDDLLDFSRIIHGKVKLERRALDLHDVIRAAVDTIRDEIESKGLQLTFALDAPACTVPGDPVRLRQVFWNVIKNAVKFTPRGGRIEIQSSCPESGGEIEVQVRDTGIGMERSDLERLFAPFAQGRHFEGERHSSYGGLGLGLAICRMLLDGHDGRIAAESDGPGTGATLTIRLPLLEADPVKATPEPAATIPAHPPAPVRAHRVLFVEDHEPTRLALSRLLRRRGYDITAAHTMHDALGRARDSDFDVLISDLGLPDGDGCMLMRELRRKRPDLPGVALSGYGMESDLARSREAGFAEHLIKPVGIESLDRALARLLTAADSRSPLPATAAPLPSY